MTLRRLSGTCDDEVEPCHGIWDDDHPDGVIVVGDLLDPAPVPLGAGEVAIRLRRQVVRDAKIG